MKAGIFLTAALVQIAAAQPHRNAHHQHKRGAVTEVAYVTATANNVVVYVDQAGNPVTTSYKNAAPTQAPAPAAPAPAVQAPADDSDAQVEAKAAAAPAPAAPAPAPAAPAPEMDVNAQAQVMKKVHKKPKPAVPSGGKGITYSPYNGDGTCKSQGQVSQDIAALSEFSLIRIYGTDCDQVNTVVNACKSSGKKIFAGVFDVNQVSSEIATMIAGVKGNWDMIETVSVGNELINAGSASAESLAAAIGTARGALNAAGYSGPVVTVDTFNALSDLGPNNALCQASDYVAANCHAFFDPNTSASEAGEFVHSWYQKLSGLCSGKKAVITESGWPSQGSPNGQAVPSPANQQTAIASIKSAFANDMDNLILFTAYNDEWKSKYNSASFFWAETSWGIYGDAPSS